MWNTVFDVAVLVLLFGILRHLSYLRGELDAMWRAHLDERKEDQEAASYARAVATGYIEQ